MTAITLDPTLNSLKIKTVQDQSNQNQVVEKIDGLITVYKNGQIERPDIVPRVTCSLPPELGLTCRDTVIDRYTNTWARIYIPNPNHHHHHHHQSTIKLPLLVYFHGGGFCIGSASWSCYHEFLSKLASKANCAILSVNYRLAPEHRLPAPYEDGAKTLKWLSEQRSLATAGNNEPHWLDQCADLSSVFLAGDSAGANIAYNVAIRSSSSSSSSLAIKGLILIQPFFGGEARTRSEIHTAQPPRSALTLAASDAYWRLSLPSGANRDHPWCNPMGKGAASLKFEGLIGHSLNVMVCVAEMDILRDRNVEFCKSLISGGNKVEQVVYKGVGHAFQILDKSSLSHARVHELISHVRDFVSGYIG